MIRAVLLLGLFFLGSTVRAADDSPANQAANTWVKRSPSGRMAAPIGYESAFAWDPKQRLLIRMAAHATDGFEQLAEVWTFDPQAGQWKLREPNTSPPGACRLGQHVFDTLHNKYLRFPGTSGDHGWQWFRELYMNESSVWAYDLETNAWRNMRPIPEPMIYRQHFASWDGKLGRAVVFGGAGSAGVDTTSVYNPHTNTWDIKKAAHQPAGRLAGNMAWCAANGLHIAFGAEGTNKDFQGYDIQKNEWRDLKPASLPPTHGNEAVLAYDSLNDVLLCVIIDREGKEMERVANYTGKRHLETWAYTPSNNSWKKMSPKREPDPGGIRCRMMTFAPELNLAFFDVRDQHPTGGGSPEVQVWSYRYAASSKQPPPPPKARPEPGLVDDLVASVISAKEVRLSWKAPGPDGIKGYVIERAPVEVYSEDELRFVKGPTPSPKEGPNVAGIKAIGEFTALAEPVAATSYTDKTVDLSKPQTIAGKKIYTDHIKQVADGGKKYRYGVFAYRIRAVNNAGLKGGPSPYVLTIPSSPQQVFSKEGGGCTVKWVANPETNLAGYRVYRIDGPRPKGGGAGQKVHRLTDQPIKATTYTDGGFKGQARYYILAVDALGQEGYPSSPVWCNRRLKDLYAPFTGEWHQ